MHTQEFDFSRQGDAMVADLMETFHPDLSGDDFIETRSSLMSALALGSEEFNRYVAEYVTLGLAVWEEANPVQAGAGEFSPARLELTRLLRHLAKLNWYEAVLELRLKDFAE